MIKFTAAIAVLGAAVIATAAPAATIVGAPGAGPTNDIYFDYTPNVGGSFGNGNPDAPRFTDTFTFTTAFERSATVDITSMITQAGGVRDFSTNVNFVSNGVKLNTTVIPVVTSGDNEQRYLANFRLPAGLQNIVINGSAGANGVYNGVLALGGVPEPGTWALMIAGFGLVGGAMRRRKQLPALATA